jgi:hypothetical protein
VNLLTLSAPAKAYQRDSLQSIRPMFLLLRPLRLLLIHEQVVSLDSDILYMFSA